MPRRTFDDSISIARLVAIGVIALSSVGLVATRVGGATIRNATSPLNEVPLTVAAVLVPGIPTTIHWPVTASNEAETVAVYLRTDGHETLLDQVAAASGVISVTIPCDDTVAEGTMLLREIASQRVVAHASVTLLPPSYDCAA